MRLLLSLVAVTTVASIAHAEDWPQWMGPNRDNVWNETGILDKFPEGGPKIVWRQPIGNGYAGPAVANGKVFVSDYLSKADVKVDNFKGETFSGTERIKALDAATGKQLWQHEYPVTYKISYPSGPRCTPTVADGKVYFLGAVGNLICCETDGGKIVWQKDLAKEYDTKPALWGYAAHPVIDGDKLITLAGGKDSHIVALDKNTGKELWRAGDQREQGYSPVKFVEAAGTRQMIVSGPYGVYAVDPETGKKLWETPYEATSGSIIMTPIVYKDYLYIGGYRGKNLMLKLKSDEPGVEVLWRDKKGLGLSPVNVQPFQHDEGMYGIDEDGQLYYVEIPSGERVWGTFDAIAGKQRGSDTAFLVKNDNRFFIYNDLGELVIATLTPDGYTEIDRTKILEMTNKAFGHEVTWSMPAFANKRMYVRNDKEIVCVDLAK